MTIVTILHSAMLCFATRSRTTSPSTTTSTTTTTKTYKNNKKNNNNNNNNTWNDKQGKSHCRGRQMHCSSRPTCFSSRRLCSRPSCQCGNSRNNIRRRSRRCRSRGNPLAPFRGRLRHFAKRLRWRVVRSQVHQVSRCTGCKTTCKSRAGCPAGATLQQEFQHGKNL